MGFTTSYANDILKTLFSGAYLALSTTEPAADGGNVTEPAAANGYARADASKSSFSTANRTVKNTAYVYYPEATASWGTITHLCIYKSGTLVYFGKLNEPVSVPANTVPLFKPETIQISLDAD